MIPKRKPSSRVQLNGLIRHRGSMLNLIYSSPDCEEIQQLAAAAKEKLTKEGNLGLAVGQQHSQSAKDLQNIASGSAQ